MKRLLLVFTLVLGLKVASTAQVNQSPFTYRLEVQGITETNLLQATSLLSHLSSAEKISFDATKSVFTVITKKDLDKNIISGKMQKNFFPVTLFQKAGEPATSFPKMKNTGNSEADAAAYELEKAVWIKENPEEYQQMLNNPSPSN